MRKKRDVSESMESHAVSGNAVITAGPIITRSGNNSSSCTFHFMQILSAQKHTL